jgi:hypothetical protein
MVRWFTLGPVESPLNPQLYGIHTIVTSLPFTLSDFIRGVIAASIIAVTRLRGEPIKPSPKLSATIADSVQLARMIMAAVEGIG